MNGRLQQFLDLEQLTSSRLADILGIQRSSVSHILNGRNKPGYDFISRFMSKFPQISIEWLLNGKGKPYKEKDQVIENKDNSDLFNLSYPSEDIVSTPTPTDRVEKTERNQDINKKIRRITIFYSDGSFDELYPPKI